MVRVNNWHDGNQTTPLTLPTLSRLRGRINRGESISSNFLGSDPTGVINGLNTTGCILLLATDITLSADDDTDFGNITIMDAGGSISTPTGRTTTINKLEGKGYMLKGVGDYLVLGEYVYPEWFGALGNNVQDDTPYIQKAFDSTDKYTIQSDTDNYAVSIFYRTPTIKFEKPRYKIGSSININSKFLNIKGIEVVLDASEAATDFPIFNVTNFYRMNISGFKFIEGSNAVRLTNSNTDTSTVLIEKCEFHNTRDYSIFLYGSQSSLSVVKDCKFIYPNKVLHTNCDWTSVENCWATVAGDATSVVNQPWMQLSTDPENLCTNPTTGAAAFGNGAGTLVIKNLLGVPSADDTTRADRPRWVDNYGNVFLENSRFGGEDGGIPIVYNFANWVPGASSFIGPAISVIGCQANCGAGNGSVDGTDLTDSAIVNLQDGLPQIITLKGNFYTSNAPLIRAGGTNIRTFISSVTNPRQEYTIDIMDTVWHSAGALNEYRIHPELWQFEKNGNFGLPVGLTEADEVSGGLARKTYTFPKEMEAFIAKVTVSARTNGGSGRYRMNSTYLLSYTTQLSGSVVDSIEITPLLETASLTTTPQTKITTAHFGSAFTGATTQTSDDNDMTITVVWDQIIDNELITIEILHSQSL